MTCLLGLDDINSEVIGCIEKMTSAHVLSFKHILQSLDNGHCSRKNFETCRGVKFPYISSGIINRNERILLSFYRIKVLKSSWVLRRSVIVRYSFNHCIADVYS